MKSAQDTKAASRARRERGGAGRDTRGHGRLKGQLLVAAKELFCGQGFASTSVQQITDRAGTSVGSLYYYYGGKNEIYKAVFADYMQGQGVRTREAVVILREAGVTDGPRLFLAGVRAFLNNAWDHRAIVKMFADGDTPPGFVRMSTELTQEWMRRNEALLHVDDKMMTTALVTAATGAMSGLSRALADLEDPEEAQEFIDRSVSVFEAILGRTRPEKD